MSVNARAAHIGMERACSMLHGAFLCVEKHLSPPAAHVSAVYPPPMRSRLATDGLGFHARLHGPRRLFWRGQSVHLLRVKELAIAGATLVYVARVMPTAPHHVLLAAGAAAGGQGGGTGTGAEAGGGAGRGAAGLPAALAAVTRPHRKMCKWDAEGGKRGGFGLQGSGDAGVRVGWGSGELRAFRGGWGWIGRRAVRIGRAGLMRTKGMVQRLGVPQGALGWGMFAAEAPFLRGAARYLATNCTPFTTPLS